MQSLMGHRSEKLYNALEGTVQENTILCYRCSAYSCSAYRCSTYRCSTYRCSAYGCFLYNYTDLPRLDIILRK